MLVVAEVEVDFSTVLEPLLDVDTPVDGRLPVVDILSEDDLPEDPPYVVVPLRSILP